MLGKSHRCMVGLLVRNTDVRAIFQMKIQILTDHSYVKALVVDVHETLSDLASQERDSCRRERQIFIGK